jgi:hypothetical protein
MFMDEIVEALKPKETKRLDIRNITIVNFPALTFEGRSIFEILQSQVRWEIWRRNMTLSLNSIPRDLDPDNVYQLLAGVRTSEEPAQAMNALAAIVSAAMVARPPPDKPKCDDDGDEDEDMDTDRPVMQPWDSYDLEGRMGLLRFISRSEYFPEVKEPRFTLETGGCNVQYW